MLIAPERYFLYIFFFILDTLALVFMLLIFTMPAGIFINFFSNVCYFIFLLLRFGPQKTSEKLFKFKGQTKSQNIKRIFKVVIGDFVPYVNIWSVYDDFKQERKEVDARENKLATDPENQDTEKKKKGLSLKEKALLGAAIVATGGAAAVPAAEALATEAATGEAISAGAVRGGIESEATSLAGKNNNTWIRKTSTELAPKSMKEKTIQEEVSGIKTGLNREDYNDASSNFSNREAYQDLIQKRQEKQKKEDEENRKQAKLKKMQGLKTKQDLRRDLFDVSKKRFGDDSNQSEKLEDEYQESLKEAA